MPSNAARLVVTVATVWYGFVPLLADLNPTHLFNPNWTPHARMHLSWLLSANMLLATYALVLIWRFKETVRAIMIGLCVVGGFWVATLTRGFYGGKLVDPDLDVHFLIGINPNLVANAMVLLLLVTGLFLHLRENQAS